MGAAAATADAWVVGADGAATDAAAALALEAFMGWLAVSTSIVSASAIATLGVADPGTDEQLEAGVDLEAKAEEIDG
jgi:hypothetical protein